MLSATRVLLLLTAIAEDSVALTAIQTGKMVLAGRPIKIALRTGYVFKVRVSHARNLAQRLTDLLQRMVLSQRGPQG
jgi:hypothetical protein